MGLFDIFKSKNPYEGILDTLHCINANQWTDSGKSKSPKELIEKSNFDAVWKKAMKFDK